MTEILNKKKATERSGLFYFPEGKAAAGGSLRLP